MASNSLRFGIRARKLSQEERAFTFLVNLDIFLEAVLPWMAPFWLALSMTGMASANAVRASSCDPSAMAVRTRLVTLFTRVRLALFRTFLISFCLALLMADL